MNDPRKPQLFKKGQSGNPQGGKMHNPELRQIRRLTAAEVAEIGSLVVRKDIGALREVVKDGKSSALKTWIATIAIKGITKGDAHSLDILLNRLIGKVKEKIELTGQDGGPVRSMIGAMSKEEQIAELERLRKTRLEAGED